MKRLHITLGTQRTTISLDDILYGLIAAKLGINHNADDAHKAVRQWVNELLIKTYGDSYQGKTKLTQLARTEIIRNIADKKLHDTYMDNEE